MSFLCIFMSVFLLVQLNALRIITHRNFLPYLEEYVASLIGLYKNSGAVLHVGINFHLIGPLYSDTELDTIISWAIMYSNCNTFFAQFQLGF